MNERTITVNHFESGTLSGNLVLEKMFPYPVTLDYVEAHASNDTPATIAVAGASTMAMAAQTIGVSGAGKIISPTADEKAATVGEAANSLISITLDYDGGSGTASENVHIMAAFLVGDA